MLTLARPSVPVRHFDGAVNRLLNGFFDEFPATRDGSSTHAPRVDLWEEGQSLHLEMDLPGYGMGDLEVLIQDETLILRGRRGAEQRENVSNWYRRERDSHSFERAFQLPVEVDTEKVEASLKAGVLHVLLPKAPHAQPRKIEVKVQSEA